MDKDALLSLISNLERWALFFGILVAVGVAGESVYGIRLYWNNRKLQDFQNREAADQQEKVKRLDKDVAEANARAEEAALELAKFKAPRSLTKEQQDRLVAKLKPFAGQLFSFNVTADPEALSFLRNVRSALNAAGWVEIPSQVGDVSIDGVGVSTDTGVKLEVAASADTMHVELVKLLDDALNAEGISSVPRHNEDLKNPSAINILVGKKP